MTIEPEDKTQGPIGPYFWKAEGEVRDQLWFHCPGCNIPHAFTIWHDNKQGPGWTWNEDAYNASFSPSLLCNADYPDSRCHLFLENGQIRFLSDCHHDLAGQTVPVPEWTEDWV